MKSRVALSAIVAEIVVGLVSCGHRGPKPTTPQQSTKEYQKTMDTMKKATSDLQNTLDEKKAPAKK